MTSYNSPINHGGAVVISVFSIVDLYNLDLRSSSLLKKASDPVIAGAARDFSSPKANKKRDSISHRYPE
jgi:hypothetical protein